MFSFPNDYEQGWTLKNEIKNQILDGKIKNKKSEALKLLTKLGKLKGLTPVN